MAKFNPNFFTQWFEKPKVSVFNRSAEKSFDLKIGPLYPAYWDLCGFGDSHKGKSLHKMRLAPLLAPNFSDLSLQEHSAVVPLRVIMPDFEATFNYSENKDGAGLPEIGLDALFKVYERMGQLGLSPIGSLFDFLGYPVFADLYKSINSIFPGLTYSLTSADGDPSVAWDYIPSPDMITVLQADESMPDVTLKWKYRSYSGISYVTPFFAWLICQGLNGIIYVRDGFGFQFADGSTTDSTGATAVSYVRAVLQGKLKDSWNTSSNDYNLIELFQFCGYDTFSSAYTAYINYVFTQILCNDFFSSYMANYDDGSHYTLLPLMAYHRFVADWNINSLYTDPDTYIQTYVYDLMTRLDNNPNSGIQTQTDEFVKMATMPAPRLWDNDFFTSLLPTSSSGDELTIPANATVIDLAKLASWQKLLLRLSYSKRYRDVVFNLFGIRPSDARLQQSSVLRSFTHNIGIGETIQTSETTASSVLGSFGGRGYSAGSTGKKGYHIFCEEPCVVLHFVSLVPNASYADALHPLIHVDDILDFPLPGTDVLGNQPIYADLVSGNPLDQPTILGYGRQYMEWIANYNTVHNNMKTSLDYWQLTRRFDSAPALNEDFLTIDENEDLDNIFSVPESSHAFLSIYYDCYVTRPIHRTVRIVI